MHSLTCFFHRVYFSCSKFCSRSVVQYFPLKSAMHSAVFTVSLRACTKIIT